MSATAGWGAAGPFLLLLIALLADAALGCLAGIREIRNLPARLFTGLAGGFDRRLNRPHRPQATRRMRGLLVAVIVVATGWAVGWAVHRLALALPQGWILEVLSLACLVSQSRPLRHAAAAARALDAGDWAAARLALRGMVRFDTGALDGHGLARAAIQGLAARFAGGLAGSVFWYLLLGLPGLGVYRAVGWTADVIGRPSPRHAAFGAVAARLDDALTLLPAVAAGLLLALGALFVPGTEPAAALRDWGRDLARRGSRDFRAEGALAGALGVALGGPRIFDGERFPAPWIGEGRARAVPGDVRRAVYLGIVGSVLVFLLVAAGLAVGAA